EQRGRTAAIGAAGTVEVQVAVVVEPPAVLGLEDAALHSGLTGIGVPAVEYGQALADRQTGAESAAILRADIALAAVVADRAVEGDDVARPGANGDVRALHHEQVGTRCGTAFAAFAGFAAQDPVGIEGGIACDEQLAVLADEDGAAETGAA